MVIENITSNVEKNDKKNQEKESPEQEVAVPEFKGRKSESGCCEWKDSGNSIYKR